ncbi:MAG TPA: hypothetical protein VIF09_09505 [Polyangiaceae bacterium]
MTMTIPTPPVPFLPIASSTPSATTSLPTSLPSLRARKQTPPSSAAPPSAEQAAYEALLALPRVRKFLFQKVRRLGLPAADKEDLVSSVFEALCEQRTAKHPPTTLPRVLGLARTVLRARLADHLRHEEVVDECMVDPAEMHGDERPGPRAAPHEHPTYIDLVEPQQPSSPERMAMANEQLDFVNEMAPKIGMTDEDVEAMWALTYDNGHGRMEELAAERGMSERGLRDRIDRLRSQLEETWRKRTGRTSFLILLLVLMLAVLAAVGAGRRTPPPDTLPELRTRQHAPSVPSSPPPVEEVIVDGPK